MNAVARGLRAIGRAVPAWLPRGTGIGNRLLKPIFRMADGRPAQRVEVWPGIHMNLDPSDCIGGNLFFSPQLYDREERAWITRHLPATGVFVDVGANIGAYTLWAASHLGAQGRVVAIEADPTNFAGLCANVALNPSAGTVTPLNVGVGAEVGDLPFYHNGSDNPGGHSFVHHPGHRLLGTIAVRPLHDVLSEQGVDSIDVLKIDIEGFEREVLRRFFADCRAKADLRPSHVIMEMGEGPLAADPAYNSDLLEIMASAGYRQKAGRLNVLFQLAEPHHG